MKKLLILFCLFDFSFSLIKAQSGIITTIAGNGINNYSGDGGPATLAEFNGPYAIVIDDSSNVLVGDWGYRIRRIEAGTDIISTVTTVTNSAITALALDSVGNIYIAYLGSEIKKYTKSTGLITVIAGVGINPSYYSGDGGQATSAELDNSDGVAVDKKGNVYIADHQNNVIRKVTASTGIITTVAGNGYGQFTGPGTWTGMLTGDGGPATSAELYGPFSVAVDSIGNIYIADGSNNVIRKVTSSNGIISRVAGNGSAGYYGDGGPATEAELWDPTCIALDKFDNVYIIDANNAVRLVSNATRIITTVAGNNAPGFFGDGGQATAAELHAPSGVVCDKYGNMYIADYDNMRVRKVTYNSAGINNIEKKSEIKVYPNPTKGIITFEFNKAINGFVDLFDVKGSLVLHKQITNSVESIDCSGLTDSVYLYKVADEKGNIAGEGKVVIQK